MSRAKYANTSNCQLDDCPNYLPEGRKKYCSDRCSQRAYMRRYRSKKKRGQEAAEDLYHDYTRTTSDTLFDEYVDRFAEDVQRGKFTRADVAVPLGVTVSHVTKLHNRWLANEHLAEEVANWEPPEPYSEDPVEDFVHFRNKCFQTPEGEPYTTPEFQKVWLKAILGAYENGDCLEILSPPRHGKTELLTHLCVWLIIRNPNVRIVYIGGSAEIADQSVESAKSHLEHNDQLKEFLPPGGTYKPGQKSGRTWTRDRFTVATRTVTGIKSPTMVAVGRGGKMPSRDADIIIVDDPEDHDSTINPGTREDTRGWMAKSVLSRKEAKTCLFVIGSRVHPDDLVGHLANSPNFDVIIEQAHDPLCELPSDDHEAHQTCMLWPEVRDHKWLMAKKDDPLEGMFFQMVYQNEALDDEMAHFRPEDIDACKDPSRTLGHVPKRTRLVAGLDPSVTGYQAAFLWAVDLYTGRRYMVDMDNRAGGGIGPALEIMKRWYTRYDLRVWVIEDNLYHGAIEADDNIRDWARANYVMLEGHETYGNKWDREFGVAAMARYFTTEADTGEGPTPNSPPRLVSLPTGDENSRTAVALFRKQLINFNRDALGMTKKKRPTGDVLMASWFPETVIRTWMAEEEDQAEILYDQTEYPFEPMILEGAGWG